MPRMKIVVAMIYKCPTCRKVMPYTGVSPAPDCPDCRQREEAGQVAMVRDESAREAV